jgi:hypothetical protein
LAPISAIRRLSTLPKCTGSWLWHCGQSRWVDSPRHSGQRALARNPSEPPLNTGGSASLIPNRPDSEASRLGSHRVPFGPISPVQRNMIFRCGNGW